jgi:hypothetical protein
MVNEFTNIKERVVQYARKQPMSLEKFFRSINMSSANFRGKAKDSPLNSKTIANIITKYPDIDLYWLLLGERKGSVENVLNEDREPYITENTSCKEKDEMIAMLKSQVEDLKADKRDLRELLKLARERE